MKTALLLSGGYDSVACLVKYPESDLFFFNYNQSYLEQELAAITYLEKTISKKIIIINKNWHTDIKNRNFLMIIELNSLGYERIIIGTRNIFPWFDRYKDSNWLNMKLFAKLLRITVTTPLIGLKKTKIEKIINKKFDLLKLYSTEI